MTCPTCGAEVPENAISCNYCGTVFSYYSPTAETQPLQPLQTAYNPAPPAPEVKLLSPWAYFGLQILFAIPVVGFILLIVFSLDNSNLNRHNFVRSYWCGLVLGLIIAILAFILLATTGAGSAIVSQLL